MAAGITPQSGLLEINGRLKVNEAINPNDVLTRNSLGKKSEKSFFANELIDIRNTGANNIENNSLSWIAISKIG